MKRKQAASAMAQRQGKAARKPAVPAKGHAGGEAVVDLTAESPKPPPAAEPTPVAIKRLTREFESLVNAKDQSCLMAPTKVNGDLFHWETKIRFTDTSTSLGRDLERFNIPDRGVVVRIRFQPTHPFDPPRLRVVYPRFLKGSSNVLAGGAICVDTFSTSGWSPAMSAEKCLQSVQSLLLDQQLAPRLDPKEYSIPYTEAEWEASFKHIQKVHSDWDKRS